ncbi:MAG: WG repeat-containing protein [Crocinitomicaceae bacterium]|nr:WG repeat-containing protein [Crocinitomicaceae bacterium]
MNYDFVSRGFDAAYARQVHIDACEGKFLKEIEVSSFIETLGETSNKFEDNYKYGFESFGEIVIPAEYDELPEFYSSFMIAKKNGKYGVINGKNEILIDFIYDKIEFHKSSLDRYNGWYLKLKKGELMGLYEREKGMVIQVLYASLVENDKEQIVAVTKEGKQVLFNLRTGKFDKPSK